MLEVLACGVIEVNTSDSSFCFVIKFNMIKYVNASHLMITWNTFVVEQAGFTLPSSEGEHTE